MLPSAVKMLGDSQSVFLLSLIIILSICLLSYLPSMDRAAAAKVATDSQVNATANFTDQLVQQQQKNLISNQSSDLKDIKRLTSEEVQILKNLGQGFNKTTRQAAFTTLSVFLLGLTLVIYGLRLTLKATDRSTSRYFKAMMWTLTAPVIVVIAVYQIGILLGNSIIIYRSDEPFFFLSLVLLIPTAIVVFLLIAERRLVARASQHHQGQE